MLLPFVTFAGSRFCTGVHGAAARFLCVPALRKLDVWSFEWSILVLKLVVTVAPPSLGPFGVETGTATFFCLGVWYAANWTPCLLAIWRSSSSDGASASGSVHLEGWVFGNVADHGRLFNIDLTAALFSCNSCYSKFRIAKLAPTRPSTDQCQLQYTRRTFGRRQDLPNRRIWGVWVYAQILGAMVSLLSMDQKLASPVRLAASAVSRDKSKFTASVRSAYSYDEVMMPSCRYRVDWSLNAFSDRGSVSLRSK